ncbi:MAG: MGMT family protein [Pseudomonadota bacterium]|nr:MGMT family protein [Pseudomonadota bacterium]
MVAAWRYEPVPSPWGEVTVVWRKGGGEGGEKAAAIILPGDRNGPAEVWKRRFPGIRRGSAPAILSLGADLRRALQGEAVRFSLDSLALAFSTDFEEKVLMACFRIPRGAVLSYGELARQVGVPRGARAVGRVMAGNPFPIVIPCHRVVRGDGTLGGYGGGLAMKETLLAWEGRPMPAPRGRPPG